MKKFVTVLLVATALIVSGEYYVLAEAQNAAIDAKPTFLAPTPGLFVNGWPPFAVSYPKDWVEQPSSPGDLHRVGVPRPSLPPSPVLAISAFPNLADIGGSAGLLAGFLRQIGKDVKVLYDKPSKLQDGTPAQEAEIEWVLPDGAKINSFLLATKKESMWIWVSLHHDQGAIGDDLKKITYSLKVPLEKQEPVKLPADVQAFLDKVARDVESGDVSRAIANTSDRYLHNGMKKAALEQFFRYAPASPLRAGIASTRVTVTMFEPQGDKAYLAGFISGTLKSGVPSPDLPIGDNQIIKENGQWKWYGNQK